MFPKAMIACWLIYNLRCPFLLLEVDQGDNTKHILDVQDQMDLALELPLVQVRLMHKMPMQWQSNYWSSKSHVVLPIMAMTMHLSL
jgi:hypothetical protein